jgi:hypothetical protein
MKKKILVLLVCVGLLFASCAQDKTIDGVTYRPYGLLNMDSQKNPNINYEVSGWAVFSGVVFFEMIVPPIYIFGYNLFEPVSKKSATPGENGVIKPN